ncbi:MAG: TonB-dependent receptor, partial [Bacteroidota bacterium]
MKHIPLTLLVYFSLLSSLTAQSKVTLSGYLKDATNGEDLIGATVILTPVYADTLSRKNLLGATTNAYGYYSISIPSGDYEVEFSFIGYEAASVNLTIERNTVLDYEIKEKIETLSEVVVNANKNLAQNDEISVEKLKAETIEKLPAILGEPDVLRAIQLLPGVSSANEASSGFNVRGGSADQNLILLDEGIIYNASHLFGLFSVFNTDAINNVTLYKGGIPASFGGRLSSVLDIQQREGNRKEFVGKASIG